MSRTYCNALLTLNATDVLISHQTREMTGTELRQTHSLLCYGDEGGPGDTAEISQITWIYPDAQRSVAQIVESKSHSTEV